MTWIMIEPNDLTSVAGTLRRTAADLESLMADVHGACCNCSATPGLDGYLTDVGNAVRRDLSGVGAGFRADATNLDAAATLIVNDSSLASSASAAWGTTAEPNGGAGPSFGGVDTAGWLNSMDVPTSNAWTQPDLSGWVNSMDVPTRNGWTQPDLGGWMNSMEVPTSNGWTQPDLGGWMNGMEAPTQNAAWPQPDLSGWLDQIAVHPGVGGAGASVAMPPIVWTGTGQLGLSVAGIGGPSPVWTIDQIEAANGNITLDGGSYVHDLSAGLFNGSRGQYAFDHGLDMGDPNVIDHTG